MGKRNIARMRYLDSMRGIASLIVVIAHYLAAFYPYTLFGSSSAYPRTHAWEEWLLWPPFSILTAGEFAVCLFFVLSGYVLAAPLIGRWGNVKPVLGAIIKRPIRLGGLVVFSVLLASMLWWGDAFLNIDVTKLPNTEMSDLKNVVPWFAYYWLDDFAFSTFLNDVLHFQAGKKYNPPLWTLYIEFYGSFYVFFSLLVINWFNYAIRVILLFSLLFLTYGQYYDGFFFGMLLADAQKQRWAQCRIDSRLKTLLLSILAISAVLAMTYPFYGALSFWNSLTGMGWPNGIFLTPHISMLGAMAVFIFVILSRALQKKLEYPLLTKLGDISFAVYVLHFLILGTLSAQLVIQLTIPLGYDMAVFISMALSLPLLIWSAYWTTIYIDKPTIQLARSVQITTYNIFATMYEFSHRFSRK